MIPALLMLLRQPRPLQRSVLIGCECHWIRSHPALSVHNIPLAIHGELACHHGSITAQVVPGALVLIPGIMNHKAVPAEPVPFAILIQVPGITDVFPGIAQVEPPAPVFLLPAGLQRIILDVAPDAYKALPPASGGPGAVPLLAVGRHVLVAGPAAAMAAERYLVSVDAVDHLHVADLLWAAGIIPGKLQHVPYTEITDTRRHAVLNRDIYGGELVRLVDAGRVQDTEALAGLLVGITDGT